MAEFVITLGGDDAAAIITADETISYRALLARAAALPEVDHVFRAPGTVPTLVTIHAALLQRRWFAPLHPASPAAIEERLRARVAQLSIAPSTLALLSTSGSTGEPKLVELSREAFAAHAHAANTHLGLRSDDRWLVALPLAHTGGLAIVMRCLAAHAAIVVAQPPSLGLGFGAWLVEATRALQVTRWSLVPAQLQQLLSEDRAPPPSLRSVLLGGQAAPRRMVERALTQGWPVVTSYGLTETCGMCVATRIGESSTAVGRALEGVTLRVVDDQLEIGGPVVASRVHGLTDAFSADGWLRTADRAELGDGGELHILGRADSVIISAGHKIDPLEVEAVLEMIPDVERAVVLGIADVQFGSRLAAVLVASPADGQLSQVIATALTAALPRYKHPRSLHLVKSLPLLPSGKIDRVAAAQLVATTPAFPR